jgi:PAS domain S-box-containing protein
MQPYLVSTLPEHQLAELHRLMNEEVEDVAVFFLDTRGIITVWNRAAEVMKGFTAQDAIGQHLSLLYTDEDRARHWAEHNLGEAAKHGFYKEETWRRRKGGGRFWARVALTALRDHSGTLVGFSKITMDLTDHKMLERLQSTESELRQAIGRLQEADRRKDEFLAMLAHELRNPLAPIRSAAEVLRRVKLDEAHVRRTSEIIARQADHMTSLVDDLLDVSRVTRGLVELECNPLEMRLIVTEAVEQVNPVIQSRNHHLWLQLAPGQATVLGDRKRLVQVVANLLNNSAKFTPEGGNIQLRTEVRDGHVVLHVSDDGIGMEPETAARVFELFAQAERTPDRSSGGLGLGLALVKSLVELQGGSVTCSSQGLGQGSTFTVSLPLSSEGGEHAQGAGRSPGQAAAGGLRVTVVDDNVDAATMLALLLDASGHRTTVEHGSVQALERSRHDPADVYLLDIGLPEMDGNELARRLRAQPETARSVLIAVTGYGQEHDRQRALQAGFAHHLVKPVDPDKLNALLAQVRPR